MISLDCNWKINALVRVHQIKRRKSFSVLWRTDESDRVESDRILNVDIPVGLVGVIGFTSPPPHISDFINPIVSLLLSLRPIHTPPSPPPPPLFSLRPLRFRHCTGRGRLAVSPRRPVCFPSIEIPFVIWTSQALNFVRFLMTETSRDLLATSCARSCLSCDSVGI